jgi:signal transduction histidine kinase
MKKEKIGKKINIFLFSFYRIIKKVINPFVILNFFLIFNLKIKLKKLFASKISYYLILTLFFLITINQIIFLIFYKFPILYFFIPFFLKFFYSLTSYNPFVYLIDINDITIFKENLVFSLFKKKCIIISKILQVQLLLYSFILNLSILSLKIILIALYSKFFLIDSIVPFIFLNEEVEKYLFENTNIYLYVYFNSYILSIKNNSYFKNLNFFLDNFRILNLLVFIDCLFSLYLCYICLYSYTYLLRKKDFTFSLYF